MRRTRQSGGQAGVETLGVGVALMIAAVVGWQVVVTAHAWQSAQSAARTGARAELVGAPVGRAGRAVLPGRLARDATVAGGTWAGEVRVRVRVPRVMPGGGHIFGVVTGTAGGRP